MLPPPVMPATQTLVLPMAAPFVAVTVNGMPMRLRVAFDAPLPVVLTTQAAARARLAGGGRSTVLVGPVRLTGEVATADLAIGSRHRRARVIWMPAAPTGEAGVDGLVSPAALPVETVRIGRERPAARTGAMAVRVDPATGIAARMAAEGGTIDLFLAPQRPESIATAAAGAALLAGMGGTIDPAIPPTRRILFGIDRPVRWLTLGRPLRVAGLVLGRLLVRSADAGGGGGLADAAEPAPDEIVVTGGGRGKAGRRLTLGADALGRCAAITWTAATGRIVLECP